MGAIEKTITDQIAALTALSEHIDDRFTRVCETITGLHGKLIVTGMGKAGLIGQKISATLRSTGQPSVFLDPAQALHGDMGMIAFGDGLLALSNSGRTDEVLGVTNYCREHGVPVMAITADLDSPLRALAETTVTYPMMPEGCPIQRAPMASCMMMLAIGDAIASDLMTRRGFTQADFLALHHGGYLGRVIAEDIARSG